MKFSFLHIADIHLGRPFAGLSMYAYDETSINIYNSAVCNSLNKIYQTAVSKNVDFVLIAGDTFESKEQDFSSILSLKSFLKKLDDAGIKVFMICGNHDPLCSYNKNTFNYDENSNIKIIGLNTEFYGEFPVYNRNNEKICILHALSYREEKFNENPVKYLKKGNGEDFNIGLLHCELNSDKSSNYAPCTFNELKELDYDYFALGHIHIPSDYSSNITYSGTVQGRNIKETGRHGIRYIEVNSKNIIKNEFISTDEVRFEDLNINLSTAVSAAEAAEMIFEEINSLIYEKEHICEKYLIKINLTGCIKFYTQINDDFFNIVSEKIRTELCGRVCISQISNLLIPAVDGQILNGDTGIAGELFRTAQNNVIIQDIFDNILDSFKDAVDKCNFTMDEIGSLKQNVIKSAKDDCLSICASLYSGEENE